MATVTLSGNFQIEIPKEIREQLELSPGQRLQVFVFGDRIELIPEKPVKTMRGFLQGIDSTVSRERSRS